MEFGGIERERTERIIGVFYKVANELGYGFFESVYRRAMVIALREAGMTVGEEVSMPVFFHRQQVGAFLPTWWWTAWSFSNGKPRRRSAAPPRRS
jgi:hypothetical protein